MVAIGRPHTILYQSSIATISLYCTVSEIQPHIPKFKEFTWPSTHPFRG